ncbi:pyridoxamine 5'-phosphate oxidase family protein [Candidatus Parcubacteria bacterium]|nr:pyridoxamine 5'-phosphate oxidase family protein [Candidatus Parcubacteria bacterium]
MKIPKYIQKIINKQELYILSTSSKERTPNIIYIKFLKVLSDEQILIANNKFFKTEKNLLENPKISFIILDKKNKKSYQIKGIAEFHKDDQIFKDTIEWVKDKRSTAAIYPKSGIVLNVKKIYCGAKKIFEE